MATLNDIARESGHDLEIVRRVLREDPDQQVSKDIQDQIFQTARKLGYDFKKLKLGKRMDVRKTTVEEILNKIVDNHDWNRTEIIKYLKSISGMVERVHKRTLPDEYGDKE